MTWAGENTASGVMFYTEDGSPGSLVGEEGQVLGIENGVPKFVNNIVASGQHNLLSETHLDTIVDAPVDGDIIVASGDLWRKLPGGAGGQVLSIDASGFPGWTNNVLNIPNASGFNILDGWHAFSTGPDTTSSLSYVAVDDMTVSPGSGTYAITFSATVKSSKAATTIAIAVFVNEIISGGTERLSGFASANLDMVMATNGIVDIVDGQSISIRWKRIGGPISTVLTMESRDMMGIRIGSHIDV